MCPARGSAAGRPSGDAEMEETPPMPWDETGEKQGGTCGMFR